MKKQPHFNYQLLLTLTTGGIFALCKVASHSTASNIYKLPFTDMTFDLDVDHFIYHHIDLQNIQSRLRTTPNHYIYIDTMSMRAAGGQFLVSGYFNGSNPDRIYFKPSLKVINAD